MKDAKKFFSENWLLILEAFVVIFQSGIDGRYIRSFYHPNFLGTIFGFGLNLAVDVTSGVLGYEFTRHQQNARKRDHRTKLLAWILLVGEFALLYFALVFSHRQLELARPDEPAYLLWSLSAFAPSACLLIGVAQALRDGQFEHHKAKVSSAKHPEQVMQPKQSEQSVELPIQQEELSKSPAPSIPPPIPLLEFSCRYCKATFPTVKALNGHMKAHPVADRSNGHEKVLSQTGT